jgi:predicted Zn-dependent protease
MRRVRRYRRIEVLVADTMETDARSFPGGTIVVFRGMLHAAQSEAALVAILGHELSHIDHGHQLRQLKSLKLAQRTFMGPPAGMDFQQMMSNTMFLAQALARPFRPEDETEADADGVTWAHRSGYDPLELAKLFLRMDRRDKDRGNNIPAFFRTHPYHRDRYEAVVAKARELQRTEPRDDLYVGQRNLVELVPRSKRRYDP